MERVESVASQNTRTDGQQEPVGSKSPKRPLSALRGKVAVAAVGVFGAFSTVFGGACDQAEDPAINTPVPTSTRSVVPPGCPTEVPQHDLNGNGFIDVPGDFENVAKVLKNCVKPADTSLKNVGIIDEDDVRAVEVRLGINLPNNPTSPSGHGPRAETDPNDDGKYDQSDLDYVRSRLGQRAVDGEMGLFADEAPGAIKLNQLIIQYAPGIDQKQVEQIQKAENLIQIREDDIEQDIRIGSPISVLVGTDNLENPNALYGISVKLEEKYPEEITAVRKNIGVGGTDV